ncbi:PadR family transcriptional regulator [Prauserella shujinwangii]|uniref:PadR family transcriptional regulator n=1 Tax=Prauserella shujinwangii TaxID=1453103 RepID=A0A2T0LT89_9PSEU|nr:helix-turn-helix transcriptional regulator [Prauserella shujinwangii]PRX46949.1 PadR family transcriptional regulator [Prauserella shujinwangii]
MDSEVAGPAPRRSGLALVVLALLAERPMHPYLMQRLIRERGKDTVVNVASRNSVNQTVERLRRDGQIAVQETTREGNRPERTVFRITGAGRTTLHRWMREILSRPAREFPELPAGLSFAALFGPDEVRQWLEHRAAELERSLAELSQRPPDLPRVFLLEDEYRSAMVDAELRWVRGIVGELRRGTLTWDTERLRSFGWDEPGRPGSSVHRKES